MRVQIRYADGSVLNKEVDTIVDFVCELTNPHKQIEKLSFDFYDARLALHPDGTYQIFAGLINYPNLEK